MLERAVADTERVDRKLALGLEAELPTAALMAHETTPLRTARAARANPDLPGASRCERMPLSSLALESVVRGDARGAVEMAQRAVEGWATRRRDGRLSRLDQRRLHLQRRRRIHGVDYAAATERAPTPPSATIARAVTRW
jgi:hypothetical protein